MNAPQLQRFPKIVLTASPSVLKCFVSNKMLVSLCQLRNKDLSALFNGAMNFTPASRIRILIVNSCIRSVAESYMQGSYRMVDGSIHMKTSAPHSLMTTNRLNLLSVSSISLDSTFKPSTVNVQYILKEGNSILYRDNYDTPCCIKIVCSVQKFILQCYV